MCSAHPVTHDNYLVHVWSIILGKIYVALCEWNVHLFAVVDMDIYLLTATGFPPGDSGRYTCTNVGKRQRKRETIHKTIHKTIQKQYKNNKKTRNTKI